MSSNLESSSRLMFYPTDIEEIYRIIGTIGTLSMDVPSREFIKEYLGKNTYQGILIEAMDNGLSANHLLYDYLLNKGEFQLIHDHFRIAFGYSTKQFFTIFDPFAGEGKWLELFKTAVTHENIGTANLHLIANELEYNRYQTITNNKHIDEHYNKPYEDFNNLPKGSVSLMLYNPPYGSTNGIRNVKHYLQMIIDDKLLFNSIGSQDQHDNGKIIMVIRKDDLLDSLPLIVEHFHINKEVLYKVNEQEYTKYKQYVVYAELRSKSLDKGNANDSIKLQQEVQEIIEIVNSNPNFQPKMYEIRRFYIPDIPYHELRKNHEIVEKQVYKISDMSNTNWDWIFEMTEVKDVSKSTITKPTPIKVGELANLIASGIINGEMELDGKGKHIVAGGIKNEIKEEITKEEDKDGKEKLVKKKTLYSEPYLNILISKNGKAKIKELSGESVVDLI